MASERHRSKPTTSFTLTPRHIAFLERTALEYQSNRSWVLGRILDLFMSSPNNLITTNVAIDADVRAAD